MMRLDKKNQLTTFLLAFFLGQFAAHRFYHRKWKTGILMLATCGGLLLWWLIDLFLISLGRFRVSK